MSGVCAAEVTHQQRVPEEGQKLGTEPGGGVISGMGLWGYSSKMES